ncbi:MAG: hypothetical protein M1816_007952 [Peltula sp. TS41687]|nr:MAG: hypothetical protein M1816_007952 [Peltula sp. TS41687]
MRKALRPKVNPTPGGGVHKVSDNTIVAGHVERGPRSLRNDRSINGGEFDTATAPPRATLQTGNRHTGEEANIRIPEVVVDDHEERRDVRGANQLTRRPDFPQWRSPFQAPGLYSGRAEYEENVLLQDNTKPSLKVSMFDRALPLPPPPLLRPMHLPSISESILQGPWRLSFASSMRKPSALPTISADAEISKPEKRGSQLPTLSVPDPQLSDHQAAAEVTRVPRGQASSNKLTAKKSDLGDSSNRHAVKFKRSGEVESGRSVERKTEPADDQNVTSSTNKLQVHPTEHGPIVPKTSMHLGDMLISQRLASSSISLLRFAAYARRREKSLSTSSSSFDSSRSSHSLPHLTIGATNPKPPSDARTLSRRQSSSVYTSQGNSGDFSDGSSIFEKSLHLAVDRGKHRPTVSLESMGAEGTNDDSARRLPSDGDEDVAHDSLSGLITAIDGDDITETLSDVYKQEINMSSSP